MGNRIIIAGSNSGCGKTTITAGIIKGFINRGLNVDSYKCGPDYIDPMFHSYITKKPSRNLDSFFLNKNDLNYLLYNTSKDADLSIIEGVMGLYDGLAMTTRASTYEVAEYTNTPIIVVINVTGMATTLLSIIKGILEYQKAKLIKGVILNNCSAGMYSIFKDAIEQEFDIKVVGYVQFNEEISLDSRHLGLVLAKEIEDLDCKLTKVGEMAEATIDLDEIYKISKAAVNLDCIIPDFQKTIKEFTKSMKDKVRIAVAYDNAFCFYYKDNLELLERLGAELVYFSPLNDESLPEDIDGIYIGGGYPELYLEKLSSNKTMLEELKNLVKGEIPIIAECGGYMYLSNSITGNTGNTYTMVEGIDSNIYMTKNLNPRFGYITLEAKSDSLILNANEKAKGHEFHYSKDDGKYQGFTITKPSGKQWSDVAASETNYCGYPHLYFYSNVNIAINFIKKAQDYRREGLI
ncbi:cobyrinate a,c-diamide synthase [Clostridium cellulovorans]|uniref:Cobyrinate a,c-diamide synthase n=1 Tax=Clostridium cellulovorans (strain ATCC 35296 / DSM 3052 / OCM 3 / 743B) TaxID=573061 RepID=D9SNZ8_CLOC7|nr:cobyrinate a,c-diamide synthase [Clostridium cellulovorans]ADL51963.1 cobyrinic acid a,c-diamide synthase [Clostridium cellulovorans 743B]